MSKINQKGSAPLLLILVIVGMLAFLGVSYLGPFKNKIESNIFPKEDSDAAVVGGVVELSVLPTQLNVAPGGTFKLDIKMDTHEATASAAQIQLNFDSQLLEATQIVNGGFLPQDLMPGTIAPGKATIVVGAQPGSAKTGVGVVASISFKALSTPTQSTIAVLDPIQTQVAILGAAGDSAGVLNPANISIGTTPTPTPTVAPTPNPSTQSGDTLAPTVSLISPVNGSSIARNAKFTISANASDNIQVSKVEFYVDGNLKATDATTPYSAITKIAGKRGASHTIMVKAYDAANNSSSASITVSTR